MSTPAEEPGQQPTIDSAEGLAGPTPQDANLAVGERLLLGDLDLAGGDALPSREDVEPYLAALLQAEHLNLILGAGLTTGLTSLAGFVGGPDMGAQLPLDGDLGDQIEVAAQATAAESSRGAPNLEDRLRIAIAAADGLRYVGDDRAPAVDTAIEATLKTLHDGVVASEKALLAAVDSAVAGDMTLRGVLMTFLGAFAGRAPTRDRLHVFTTNYDRVLEWGAELAGLRIVDRFVGSLEPVFRSSRLEVDYHYSPPGTVREPRHLDGVLRLTKLHGSLDWRWDASRRNLVRSLSPFGADSATEPGDLMVFPNSAKDVETTFFPYADLFRDFSAALCRPHTAVVTYGYSFGDDHINRVIRDMLTIPSTHLLIISWDDSSGRIAGFVDDHRRLGQVSLMIGESLAGLPQLVGRWLPWPSAEFLLQRRAQIYRGRSAGTGPHAPAAGGSSDDSDS